jgi:hypothetical protein
MKWKSALILLLSLFVSAFLSLNQGFGQSADGKPIKKSKAEKEAERIVLYNKVDSLIKRQQFAFQAEYSAGSDEIFVIVDSAVAVIQNGNRNNLEGRITKYEVFKNEKNNNISITIMMRGAMSNGDIFLYLDQTGNGRATIKSTFPGYFSFNGNLVDLESANIYDGGSHFIH